MNKTENPTGGHVMTIVTHMCCDLVKDDTRNPIKNNGEVSRGRVGIQVALARLNNVNKTENPAGGHVMTTVTHMCCDLLGLKSENMHAIVATRKF